MCCHNMGISALSGNFLPAENVSAGNGEARYTIEGIMSN